MIRFALLLLTLGVSLLTTACTTIEIPTAYGTAKVTAPVFLTTQDFSLSRTSDTLSVKYQRGTDPQATAITSATVSAAVTAAITAAKR